MKWLVALLLILSVNFLPALAAEEVDRPTGAEQKQIRLMEGVAMPEPDEESSADTKTDMSLSAAEDGFTPVSANNYYGYKTLKAEDWQNRNVKLEEAYEDLAEGIAVKRERIDLREHNLTETEMKKVFFACLGDYPQFFWLRSGYYYYLDDNNEYVTALAPCYETGIDVSTAKPQFANWAQTIIDASGVKSGMSDYEKAIMLHDELARRISYDYDALDAQNAAGAIENETERDTALQECAENFPGVHSAYGALVRGKAVCDGYAKAYQYLLYRVGIVSHLVTGTANGGGHAWNLVSLDGDWYYTDLTWDDDNTNGILFYAYYNMTSAQSVGSTHVLDNPYAMPTCTATQDNYFVKNGLVVETLDTDIVAEQLKKGPIVRLYVTGSMADAQSWLFYDGDDSDTNPDNIVEVMRKSDVSSIAGWFCIPNGGELYIHFNCDKVGVHENMVLEIGSTTAKTVKIFQAFYDENDVLIKTGVTEGTVSLNAGVNRVKVNYTADMDEFKKVKYFLWDGVSGLKPLYDVAEMEY